MYATMLQFASGFGSIVANLYQRRYNRLHRSVYGLSYDTYVLDIVGNCVGLYCTLNFMWSPLVKLQMSNRFPLFYPISEKSGMPLSTLLLMRDILHLTSSILVLQQLLIYRSTKHIRQGVSVTCLSLLVAASLFGIFTYTCACSNLPLSNSGRFGIFYIEHVNYMWVIGNSMRCFKYLPQLSLNWMGLSTRGVSSKYVILNILSTIIVLVASALFPRQVDFYRVPFNLTPLPVLLIEAGFLLGILYQAQVIYSGRKPYLPRGK